MIERVSAERREGGRIVSVNHVLFLRYGVPGKGLLEHKQTPHFPMFPHSPIRYLQQRFPSILILCEIHVGRKFQARFTFLKPKYFNVSYNFRPLFAPHPPPPTDLAPRFYQSFQRTAEKKKEKKLTQRPFNLQHMIRLYPGNNFPCLGR